MKIKFIFAWYDFWVGFYWDSDKRKLYLLPIPMFGIVFDFGRLFDFEIVYIAPPISEIAKEFTVKAKTKEQALSHLYKHLGYKLKFEDILRFLSK